MIRVVSILVALLSVACPLSAAQNPPEASLPATCAAGWAMDGKAATYTPENLYKYIDGEAELYLPYGFEEAAVAMYAQPDGVGHGIVANIFRMGSLLDAFGIFASYRDPTAEQITLGAEGFIDEAQLMFYQDRYFVRIEASGAVPGHRRVRFGRAPRQYPAASRRVEEKPRELDFLKVPGTIPLTDRYYPRAFSATASSEGE